jgi:hypothetical protein
MSSSEKRRRSSSEAVEDEQPQKLPKGSSIQLGVGNSDDDEVVTTSSRQPTSDYSDVVCETQRWAEYFYL